MVRFFIFLGLLWLAGSYALEYADSSEWFWIGLLPAVYIIAMPLLFADK